ncbi:hypothetical protein MKK84_18705 [Methylobacterium sp. E-065]|uniref:hypothetical protein n=1 Tax=Methylobacterium sp. E-065 TaxID=2836583 RepID=UPI001FBAA03B|nr:hypothetical protein [Methylobacterium sp. E-065]MCJ2019442.1 hypothetical protein [Methylobacterium sp. E-065]
MLSKRIVLIDGPQLARVMIRHSFSCWVEVALTVKRFDGEFFAGRGHVSGQVVQRNAIRRPSPPIDADAGLPDVLETRAVAQAELLRKLDLETNLFKISLKFGAAVDDSVDHECCTFRVVVHQVQRRRILAYQQELDVGNRDFPIITHHSRHNIIQNLTLDASQ